MAYDPKTGRPEREFLRDHGTVIRQDMRLAKQAKRPRRARRPGLRPVQQIRPAVPSPMPQRSPANRQPSLRERLDNEVLGFLEANTVPVVASEFLRRADPRGLVTNTNPLGAAIGVWGDAHLRAIDRLKKSGTEPGGIGEFVGNYTGGKLLTGSRNAGRISAVLGVNLGGPGADLVNQIASAIGKIEDRLPAVIDFRPQSRPTTRVTHR